MKINDVPQSGSVQGVTSSRNRSGQYRRTRAIPVNPNTGAQSTVRSVLATLAAAWRTLTDEQQTGWEQYAQAHPRVNPLGTTYVLTGMQAYVGVNGELAAIGVAAVADAPTSDSPDAPVLSITEDELPDIAIGYTPTPVAAGTKMVMQSSPPRSRGVRYNSDYRTVAVLPAASASAWEAGAALTAKFGEVLDSKRYFIRAKIVTADGQSGPWSNIVRLDPLPAP